MVAGFKGGDPGTGRGGRMRAGLPSRRNDQQYRPPGPMGAVGSSTGIVKARIVITYGTGETGLFQYNGQPKKGNPPEAWAVPVGVAKDPYGNALPVNGGFASQDAALGQWSQLVNGGLFLQGSGEVAPANVGSGSGELSIGSGHVAALDNSAVIDLISRLAPGNGSGGTVVQLGNGLAPVYLQILESSAAPATPSGGGIFYTDSTGRAHYKGPVGTDTVLAPA